MKNALTKNRIRLAAGTSLSIMLISTAASMPVSNDGSRYKSSAVVLAQAGQTAAEPADDPKDLRKHLKKKQRDSEGSENTGSSAANPETKPVEEAAPTQAEVQPTAPEPAPVQTEVQPVAPAPAPDTPQPVEKAEEPKPVDQAPAEITKRKPKAMPEAKPDPVTIGSEKPETTKEPADLQVKTGKKPKSKDLKQFLNKAEKGKAEQPVQTETGGGGEVAKPVEQPATGGGAEVAKPVEAAPLTDSAKEALSRGNAVPPAGTDTNAGPAVGMEAPPETDALAQPNISIGKIESVEKEQGERKRERRRSESRESDGNVVGNFGGRLVIRLDSGGLSVINEDDRDRRLHRRAQDVYVEELRGGRTRETVIRRNGVRIVTIYNRHGDIIRRSRITPDGRETILVYVPRDRWDEVRDYGYDAGRDLPPLRLSIPRREYILEAERASRDDYYRFLNRPPVETVERLYSIDEVTRSARIRDKLRRIDMDTITFASGSAAIAESEIDELQALGDAIVRLLEDNPGETFLIEGHTDAVGSEASNLVLSDQRAESVAEVLTDFFNVPPENLVTQGYGERYLKINTPESERENRRVAVRRITALISPVNQQAQN